MLNISKHNLLVSYFSSRLTEFVLFFQKNFLWPNPKKIWTNEIYANKACISWYYCAPVMADEVDLRYIGDKSLWIIVNSSTTF